MSTCILFLVAGVIIGGVLFLFGVKLGAKIVINSMIKVLSMSNQDFETMKRQFEHNPFKQS